MTGKLFTLKRRDTPGIDFTLFYPTDFTGNEIVVCLRDKDLFAVVMYNQRIFTIFKDYLVQWGS